MKTYAAVVILTCCFWLIKANNIDGRIIGGTRAKEGQFPWQVLLLSKIQVNKYALCGGSLIGHEWVLTAAHCVRGVVKVNVELGGTTMDNAEVKIDASSHITYPKYSGKHSNHDIALVRLSHPVKFTRNFERSCSFPKLLETIQPVALPSANDRIGANVSVIVSGYGRTSQKTAGNRILYYTNLTTISNAQCARYFRRYTVISSTLCVKGGGHHNTCYGDSGGPLVRYNDKGVATQVGVASFVDKGGCERNSPSGFVRVSSYVDWIHKTMATKK